MLYPIGNKWRYKMLNRMLLKISTVVHLKQSRSARWLETIRKEEHILEYF